MDTRTSKQTSGGDGFTAEERAAMKARAAELKAEAKRGRGAAKAAAEAEEVLKAIAAMPEPDRGLAERIHAIVTTTAPNLAPKTWYGMPAYALDGKIVCFFQSADKFKARYATFGFNEAANLDDGTMWATSWALTALGDAEEALLADLVRKAVA
jgi:uncharacterized protein YdhG (YjbR/CyaY superfamily)